MYIDHPATFTDYYELTMAQGYFLSGRHDRPACFDYFFRSNPFDSGYTVFAGLDDLIQTLQTFRFTEEERVWLAGENFDHSFIDFLKNFRFRGQIRSVAEGEVVFPGEPVLQVEGGLLETQIVETLLLNILNFQSLIATKAARLRFAAGDRMVLDFGLRRSQGLGGIQATRSAIIGGLDGTSNVYAARKYGLPSGGTMAHSWIQSFDNEEIAFRTFAGYYPNSTHLLIDTYDTLGSGLPNAIRIAKEMEERGEKLQGVRIDSGDLAYFAVQTRKKLDAEGLDYVKIAVSNQLDEFVISSLVSRKTPIDIFGVGTRLVTGQGSPALDGVYKLALIAGEPTLKLSENPDKTTLPGSKKILRHLNRDGTFHSDALLLSHEKQNARIVYSESLHDRSDFSGLKNEALMKTVMKNGEPCDSPLSVMEIASRCRSRLSMLAMEYKRLENPPIYSVGISEELRELKKDLVSRKSSRTS